MAMKIRIVPPYLMDRTCDSEILDGVAERIELIDASPLEANMCN